MIKKEIDTFTQYADAAMTTCTQPQCKNPHYMSLGLVGEVGELANKVKKIIRDRGYTIEEANDEEREHIFGELGDIMWYCAGLYRFMGWKSKMLDDSSLGQVAEALPEIPQKTEFIVLEMAYHVGTGMYGGVPSRMTTMAVISCVSDMAKRMGTTLQQICQGNIEKLADRYKRNKIGGSGDDR